MKAILLPRLAGKTTQLIQMSAETKFYMVVHTKTEAARVFVAAHEMGLSIPLPLTFGEFLDKRYYGKSIKGFLIDNAELLLQQLAPGVPVVAISINDEHTEEKGEQSEQNRD